MGVNPPKVRLLRRHDDFRRVIDRAERPTVVVAGARFAGLRTALVSRARAGRSRRRACYLKDQDETAGDLSSIGSLSQPG